MFCFYNNKKEQQKNFSFWGATQNTRMFNILWQSFFVGGWMDIDAPITYDHFVGQWTYKLVHWLILASDQVIKI